MTTTSLLPKHSGLRFCGFVAACAMAATSLAAQRPTPRIQSEVSSGFMTQIKGNVRPWAQARFDSGRMPADTPLSNVTLFFNRSAGQQAAVDALIAAQQDPASPLYHQWLTPEQFGARFGMAQSDLDKVQTWLEQQGFTVLDIARSKTFIQFSGTVGQFEQAFQTEMHYYTVDGKRHFSPSTQLSVPTAFASTVAGIHGISDFKPHYFHTTPLTARVSPEFTSGVSGSVFFAPGDIKVTYDMNPLLSAAYDGSGQTIAIMGQSDIAVTDIENFQKAAGLTVKDPNKILVPNTGSATMYQGDEGESDLDLEWSGAMAPGASIYFIYTGNSKTTNGIFDSLTYAVDNKIGQIISVSYGACETSLGSYSQESLYSQAVTQGQTIIASSGDEGSTACYGDTSLTTAQQEALSVNYPASSQYVVGIGGTEISSANSTSSNTTYWSGGTGNEKVTSALKYIPEISWNDDAANVSAGCTSSCLSASGGGASALFTKPSWQTGSGVPSDGHRDVPDISFYSSPGFPGYLYCTSDQSSWGNSQTGSCGSGFRASSSDNSLTVAGGTSFAAPIFAGMLAILNQKGGYNTGQGLFNKTLYQMASNSATYSTAFHDVTSGDNKCNAGSSQCSGAIGFSAGTGYDQVTGLGSLDLAAFAGLQSGSGTSLNGTSVSISATPNNPALNANDTITITVNSASGTPTGNISITLDTGTATTAALTSGVYTYTTKFTTAGTHTISVQYAGDGTHASSSGAVSISIPMGTLSVGSVTVAAGKSGTSTVTLTPQNGYTGTVDYTFSTTSTTLTNACASLSPMTVSGTSAVTSTMTVYTNSTDCSSTTTGGAKTGGVRSILITGPGGKAAAKPPALHTNPIERASLGLLAVFLAGLIGWRFRSLRGLAGFIIIATLGLSLTACGGGGTSSGGGGGGGGGGGTGTNAPTGTYTIIVTGADQTANSNASVTATFTLTIQ